MRADKLPGRKMFGASAINGLLWEVMTVYANLSAGFPSGFSVRRLGLLLLLAATFVGSARATPDLRFDVMTLCCNCSSSSQMACPVHLEHLNFSTTNGHYIAMGDDDHRFELATNGNVLAIYYNTLNDGWTTNDGPTTAAVIEQYSRNRFTATGPRPDWIVLNEISASLWPANQAYRTWVHDVVHALRNTYGYSIILYAPFATPGATPSDWQAVAADAYIGVENYLGGEEVAAQGFSVSWCQGQYQSSTNSYNALGVPTSRLILGEHFSHNLSGSGYGRSGVSSNDWDKVVAARCKAARNVQFAGFIGYAWGGNAMNVTSNEMIHFEDTYSTNPLPKLSAVTAPGIAVQPQSATLPTGSDVGFIVFKAGTAATSYQWRRNGISLAGATASCLNLTNINPQNAGSYSVLLGNAAGTTLSSNAVLSVRVPDPLVYEPFADMTGSGSTAYAPGANLTAQTNAQGLPWYVAGTTITGPQPVISPGSLNIPGLAASGGNSVIYGNTTPAGAAPRMGLGSSYTVGTLYYSFAFRLTDLAGMGTGGQILAGFNNSSGPQTGQPSVYGAQFLVRLSGSGYNVGLSKIASTVWDSAVHAAGETLFVVGSYTLNTATTSDDTSAMWINPPFTTFGAPAAPSPTLTTSAGSDISSQIIRSFVLRDALSTQPVVILDELRIGTNWASVTPPAPIPAIPALSAVRAGAQVVLSWPTNASGFTLEATSTLVDPSAWSRAGATVYTSEGRFIATNNLSPGNLYYRLRWP